jgi:hypothetical protein
MSWYGIAAIDRAFSRTRKALFEPFDFWKWVKLAIIIFFLGSSASNFGSQGSNFQFNPEDFGLNNPGNSPGQSDIFPANLLDFNSLEINSINPAGVLQTSGISEVSNPAAIFEVPDVIQKLLRLNSDLIPDFFANGVSNEKLYLSPAPFAATALVVAAILAIILLVFLFIYISNIMEFVFVESLVKNDVKFWNYSRRFMKKGFYLFLVRLVIGLIFLMLLAISLFPVIPAILNASSEPNWPSLVGNLLQIGVVFFLLIIFFSIINSFISLAIPASLYRDTGILPAFSLIFSSFKRSWKEVIVYWLVRLVLGIAISILGLLILGILIVGLGLLFLIIDGIIYFISSAVLSGSSSWILLVPIIIIEVVLFLGAIFLLRVPLEVFMKYHLLSFLEAWFADINIPFFDALTSEPVPALKEPDTSL